MGIAVLAPVLFFGLLEAGLRVAGYGQTMSFFLTVKQDGKDKLVQNDRFAWRFFGKDLAREAFPFAIPAVKPTNTVRIFVLGESAAAGDPMPEFSMSRVLEALLRNRYPGTRFEIVNTAMPAINSHAILPIARECATKDADLWVIYMGNNEVVGPYGAGTVFGVRGASVPMVRASLAVKDTRTGQWLENLMGRFKKRTNREREWGGMEMFMNNQVRQNDPRMATVYASFERNLDDMLRAATGHGAKVVLATVASNLKDCAPFGSLHRADLAGNQQSDWETLYKKGSQAEDGARAAEAVAAFEQAAKLDDTYAELHFRWGRCCLSLAQDAEARKHFIIARDLDTLRFRADSRLNEIIRRTAAGKESRGVRLADVEEGLAKQSPHGLTGSEFLFEHVHFKYEGNYAVARVLADEVAKLLPSKVTDRAAAGSSWASEPDCARMLAYAGWNQYDAEASMLGRLGDPPFINQLNHAQELEWLQHQNEQHAAANKPEALHEAEGVYREAIAGAPEDWVLHKNLATLEQKLGDYAAAAESWNRVTKLLPHYAAGWEGLGVALAEAKKDQQAIAALETALQLQPGWEQPMVTLGQVYGRAGKFAESAAWYEKVIALKPYWGPAHLGLGQALEAMGRKDEAKSHYDAALTNRMNTPGAMNALAKFCFEKGWYKEAAANFMDALKLNPSDAVTHVNLGVTLNQLGRNAEARTHFAEAVRLDPNLADAHARLGLELGRDGDSGGAQREFAEAVRIDPNMVAVRLNLGVALMNQDKNAEAIEQFEEVLRRDPTNATAANLLQSLRPKVPPVKQP
jgi:tetratricopeptide (TPR) repeat protein